MVSTKLLVELVIIVLALAVGLWWLWTNYESISDQFFGFLEDVPLFSSGG